MLIFKEPIELMGVPGSPYTRKVVALLRYRRIQYRLLPGSRHMIEPNSDRYAERPQPKIPLLPTFYVTDDSGEEAAICDTSPVIRQLESLESERSVIPEDPVMSLINFIVEDFADEWCRRMAQCSITNGAVQHSSEEKKRAVHANLVFFSRRIVHCKF